MRKIETLVLDNLIHNESYARHVIPFLEPDYFHNQAEREVFKEIKSFFVEYSKVPEHSILEIEFANKKIPEGVYKNVLTVLEDIKDTETVDDDWLIKTTEKFCRDKAIHNAIVKSIKILDGEEKTLTEDALPSLLSDALAVSFDNSVGHDFYGDADSRYDFFHTDISRIKFDLDMFNKATKGGVPPKTLNVVLAGTNVGKSLFLCHLAAAYIKAGLNVLYITLEMAEEWLAQRIDCNIMDVTIDAHAKMSKSNYVNRLSEIEQKTHGKLIIKEYPTSSAHVGHFKVLLNDLSIKKNFKPDVILIDYLNICASQRAARGDNSYTIVKKTAEELRALGQEFNVPIWSATQTNRGGYDNTDVSMTDTSESFGLPMTVDFMFAMVRTEELDAMNQALCIQLKSRYGRVDKLKKFVVGVDIDKFKLYDVEQNAQEDVDQGPVFDKSEFGKRMKTGYDELDFS